MAPVWHLNISLFIIFSLFGFIFCQIQYNRPIPLVTKTECNQQGVVKQFFDTSKLQCADCSQNDTYQVASADGLSCVCRAGYRYVENYGGRGVECAPCGVNQVASSTGFNCITCRAGTVPNNGTCSPCNSTVIDISPERDLQGNWFPSNQITCQTCSAGTEPSDDNSRCVKCTKNLPVTADNDCTCTAGKNRTGGFCVPRSDIDLIQDGESQYRIPRTTNEPSRFIQHNLLSSFALCHSYENISACQVLGNICVLTMYEYNNLEYTTKARLPCEVYFKMVKQTPSSFSPTNTPWLYYVNNDGTRLDGDQVLRDDYLETEYTFEPVSRLEFRFGRYSLEGNYLGLSSASNGRIQLCPDSANKLNAAYVFGTTYDQSCKIAAIDFWDTSKYPLEFLDAYLLISQNEVPELYPIPVNILNYRSLGDGSDEINRGDLRDMQLFRRFFLVDNIGNIPGSGGPATMVRYAKEISIEVVLQTDTTKGVIYPPAITIDYGTISHDDALVGAEVDITFKVEYTYQDTSYLRDFQIAVGTLSTLGIIYAGYRTWVWSKRAGRPTIDFPTIANFFFFCAGTLANVFFVITFGMAFYWFIFFKRQTVVYLVHPSDDQLRDWLGLFGAAFALKFLEMAHMIFMQCMVDVFFIDWERSRGSSGGSADSKKSRENPVSIWRTYFVANEWNEIQAVRKINKSFQVWAVVFFLVVVGFENTATMDPDGSVTKDSSEYKAEYSRVYRYAVAVLVYLVTGIVQWIFFTFIYERFFEDKVRQFVDLCSMSNISVFVMAHNQYGHYIHGRSVHGKADTNMREMFEMMKKEEEDMCGQRGLLPNTEQQTFIMALPKKLRIKYEQLLLPAQLETAAAAARMEGGRGGRIAGTAMEKQAEAYSTVNRFLGAFIDRSLRDIDYVIKDKTFLESIMDTEFYDANETGIFYNDDGHSFDKVLFYGNEMTLLLFDILTFCIVDLIFTNYVVAGVITFLLSEVMCLIRNEGGQRNLAKKTLVDERFLI